MKQLLDVDRTFFLWLNSLGSQDYDWFWMMMTHRASNIVVYLILLGFIGYKNSWKMAGYLLFVTGLLILCTDQLTNLFKVQVGRLRPCYDAEIQSLVRLVKPTCGGMFSFFSGHASNSFALAVFFGNFTKSFSKYLPFILIFIAALIAYSRIYIGVHFPLDIFCGTIFGISIGWFFYKGLGKINPKFLS